MYFLLGSKKKRIRQIAREAYLRHPKNIKRAQEEAASEIRTKSIVISILIGLAIRLAIELIKYWFFTGKNPGLSFAKGEPGA